MTTIFILEVVVVGAEIGLFAVLARRRDRRLERDRDFELNRAARCMLVEAIGIPPPRHLAGEVVTEGDAAHAHKWQNVEWPRDRLGPPVVDTKGILATYKDLYRCSCGREVVQRVRALA